ncbi:MAG: ATP synthase F1 subunit delta [Ignavibacteria bacterium RIFOXYB2_FULL_35_12]|nr:MAG: ATP synthase F1 subunit delta [Ignavibacteria bacterium GWA2_36_19]OGU53144.1 MAG: ATP synthase F1 subunit delta [Ignavibacteria bacterium GWC2_35_8]OGU61452.1 MAG: ATP synthase F1 subunit delta [Ignavibacteria bacterium GWF2_35_20]OGU79934.1 MAG: ATP synthase F1 subunit delta [Ignavibacteria bacterium RBG_16_35_7]OGU81511.1 MAG: ATP synthase F1 subunit delta [Ignavibacteria bacterium RIFOXYA2_FULL_35_9]OGU85485.1 MAG: ATP synthase F1 subunit delta [Ignavibacteria bacterium RIFOXYA12_F
MAEQKVSARYASSLLDSVIQKNLLEAVSNDIELVSSVLKQNPNLNRMLENPVVKPDIKSSVLEEIFKSKINSETMEFMLFVIKKKREEILPSILEKFKELRDIKLGFVNVNVSVASEFSDSQKKELQNKLQNKLKKKVRMNYKVDEKILGGFIVQAGDTVYNASIKHQLDLLKKHFVEGSPITN